MKLPKYIKYKWDTQPTDFDKIGCDGLYIISYKVKCWGYPFLFLYILKVICSAFMRSLFLTVRRRFR